MSKKNVSEEEAKEQVKAGADKVKNEDVEKVLNRQKEIEEKFKGNGPLGKFVEDVKILFSMVQDYWNKKYTEVPWWTIAAIVTALAYVLSPIDLIPDFIPVVGYVDDAAVVAACLALINTDLQTYKEWKLGNAC